MTALKIVGFAFLLFIVAPLIGFGVHEITGDNAERAANIFFTGFAFFGAVSGAIGATTPEDPENSTTWRDWFSKIGWSLVTVGAGGAFTYQIAFAS